MSTSESVEKFLLMAGQSDAVAKAHFTSAIMTQERRIDRAEKLLEETAMLYKGTLNGLTDLRNREAIYSKKIESLDQLVASLIAGTKKKPKKKRAKKPRVPGGRPITSTGL